MYLWMGFRNLFAEQILEIILLLFLKALMIRGGWVVFIWWVLPKLIFGGRKMAQSGVPPGSDLVYSSLLGVVFHQFPICIVKNFSNLQLA